ncbi:MAG: hypothetical protein ACM3Y9_10085 [Ignavibacteria bacterium]
MRAFLEKILLVAVAIFVKLLFMIYKVLAWPLALLALFVVAWLAFLAFNHFLGAALLLAGLVLASAWALYHYADRTLPANVGAGGWASRISDRFIAWLGSIKYFSSPLCLVEDPGSYRIKGADLRLLTDGDSPLLQPGDILLRGYDGYLDGELIRRTGGAAGPAQFLSHAALYVGPIDGEEDKRLAARRLKMRDANGTWRQATEAEKDKVRNDPAYFQSGRQMVIHSMAKGVHVEDILTFLRCDYLVVLRLPGKVGLHDPAASKAPLVALSDGAASVDARLRQGYAVPREEIWALARASALGRIGTGYDFLFDSCETFHKFSCSEFVYYCYKSAHRYIGLEPREHGFAGLFKRVTVSPGDVYAAFEPGRKLEFGWSNVPARP